MTKKKVFPRIIIDEAEKQVYLEEKGIRSRERISSCLNDQRILHQRGCGRDSMSSSEARD